MAFNPLQNFQQGFQVGQQQRIAGLRGNVAQAAQQPEFDPVSNLDFQQLAVLDPQSAARTAETFENLSKARKKAYFEDMRKGRQLLESGNGEGFLDLFSRRLTAIEKADGDTKGTMIVLNRFNQGDIQGVIGLGFRTHTVEDFFCLRIMIPCALCFYSHAEEEI